MKLYILKPKDPNAGPWKPWYDKAFGFVVRASSPAKARKIADSEAGDENREAGQPHHPWLDPALSTCIELRPVGKPGLVLRDFSAA